MKKRRKVWWIGGSFVLLLLAFLTVGLMIRPNPEKLHREVQAIVRDYGFVKVNRPVLLVNNVGGWAEYEFYDAKGLDESEIKRIGERLSSACKRCTLSEVTKGSGGTNWRPAETESLMLNASVYRSSEGDIVSMDINMFRQFETSLWDRIKSWWPW